MDQHEQKKHGDNEPPVSRRRFHMYLLWLAVILRVKTKYNAKHMEEQFNHSHLLVFLRFLIAV